MPLEAGRQRTQKDRGRATVECRKTWKFEFTQFFLNEIRDTAHTLTADRTLCQAPKEWGGGGRKRTPFTATRDLIIGT
jgi:hypothetical protein